MGDRARAKWAEKSGLLCPFLWGGLGPHITQCGLGRSLPPCQLASRLKSELFYLAYTVNSLLFILSNHRPKAPLICCRRMALYNL